jgi:hypothetical protein
MPGKTIKASGILSNSTVIGMRWVVLVKSPIEKEGGTMPAAILETLPLNDLPG